MSIGYETQVPPMNILTFYNAIANNGVMVRPKFVKAAIKNGEIVKEVSYGNHQSENLFGADLEADSGNSL